MELKNTLRCQQESLHAGRLLVAMAPKQLIWDNLSIQYRFPNEALFSNLADEIASYAVQYDKELPFTPFMRDATLKHTYGSEGIKHLVFRITLKNGKLSRKVQHCYRAESE